ncbi:hypothetical protein IQ07DRAFT_641843 [Pyrenochaeta sp. DS3sAY3a]|nr:hypothetical protein IQ07DRAFT_641843 [Pyrenochaeta sp. DS3sAY3a]
MAPLDPAPWPLEINVLGANKNTADLLPATYHYYETPRKRAIGNPADDVSLFLQRELSLGSLVDMLKHLWFAGARRPAIPLHLHIAMGREIALADRMDLHLLWDNNGKLFIKPIPRYLLDVTFCSTNLQTPSNCTCQNFPTKTCGCTPRRVALGFLYTYACLISSESDFHLANELRLLPRNDNDAPIDWAAWKTLTRDLLRIYQRDRTIAHPRFHRAELRLSRLNTIHRFTSLPLFEPYLRSRYNYTGFFRNNITWITAATVFVALVLSAMQVGLTTQRLQTNASFQRASYGFTLFAILGPICAFGLVVLYALFILVKDLPLLLRGRRKRFVLDNP